MNRKPHISSLLHFAVACLGCKLISLLFGWWMGFAVMMLAQIVWEVNSRKIWIAERYSPIATGVPLYFVKAEWTRIKLYDTIYDTIAAVIGCLIWLV